MAKSPESYIWRDKKRTIFGLPLSFTTYFLTENKFITRKGFLNLEEDELDLYKIQDKKLVLPFFQRMVGCGTVEIYVRGDSDTPVKEVHCIKKPRDFMSLLDKTMNEQKDRFGTRGRDLYGGTHVHPDGDFDDDARHHYSDDDNDGDYDDGD